MAGEDTAMMALVTEAMFRALDDKKREEMIKTALATLVRPVTQGGYGGRTTTPIQDAFERAIREVAFDVVREMCKSDEAMTAIRGVVTLAFERVLIDKERLATEMAMAIVQAFTKSENY